MVVDAMNPVMTACSERVHLLLDGMKKLLDFMTEWLLAFPPQWQLIPAHSINRCDITAAGLWGGLGEKVA